jgi:hypothetical protein
MSHLQPVNLYAARGRFTMKKCFDVFLQVAAAFALLAIVPACAQQGVPANRAPHPAPEQPLPFSHKTHIDKGAQCQLCHTNPAPGKLMTFPATATCMSCHATIATDRPAIKKLAEYVKANQPIPWVRVYAVLPGVTWTHRKHLQADAQCETCHGAVAESQSMAQTTAVTGMASCVSCHEARNASAACSVCHAWPAQ